MEVETPQHSIQKKSFAQIRKVNLFTSKSGKRKDDGGNECEAGSNMATMGAKKGLGAAGAAGGAAKAPEQIAFQIEVETEAQWKNLCRREGLILVDVYAGWAGPCVSMISILKRVKVEVNDDRLWLAIANSDKISDLLMFKDQSEPTWLFIGGGKPVKVIRSANVPKLVATIKSEFQHELQCMQGKARRNLISIDDEVTRRKKAETEAIRLSKLVRDEEETTDDLNIARRESSVRLMNYMEPYSVLIIQNFLLETGVVTVIRDSLQGEFKIEQERMVSLDEAAVRSLFRIPYKIPDPNVPEDFGYTEPEAEEEEDPDKEPGMAGEDQPPPTDPDEAPVLPSSPSADLKKKKQKMIDVKLPEGLVGDTLFMLLESLDIRKIMKSGIRPPRDSPLQTGDDYLLIKVGPVHHKDALEHAPDSMHALYGKGQYLPGVWCPRRYDDKRHVMIHYFPRFVTELLMPTPAGSPKHLLAVFPASQQKNVSKEIEGHKKDVFAEGKVKVPPELADKMLKSWNTKEDSEDYKLRKKQMSGDVFAISVNRKNSTLVLALKAMEPLHVSFDAAYGKVESGKLFKELNIDTGTVPNPDEVVEKFLARSRPRVVSLTELNAADIPKNKRTSMKSENPSFAQTQDRDDDYEPPELDHEPEPEPPKPIIEKPKKSEGADSIKLPDPEPEPEKPAEPEKPSPPPSSEPEKPESGGSTGPEEVPEDSQPPPAANDENETE